MRDIYKMIAKLRYILTRRDKQFLFGLFVFSIFISLVETLGISVIMPFISVASDFNIIQSNTYYKSVYDFLGFEKEVDFVIVFGLVLMFFYICRSGINLFYFHLMARFSQGRYHLIVYRLFENYLGLPYSEFVKKNTSVLTKSIINEASGLTQVLEAFLFIMSETFIVVLIYSMMLYVNWEITLVLTLVLIINALFLIKKVSTRIKKAGSQREVIQKNFYEIINRTFGNFKLIKLSSNDRQIMDDFRKSSYGFAKANITSATLSQFPRLFLEAIAFGFIALIITCLVYKNQNDISSMMGLLSMFVLGLYRLMPSVNRILNSYNQIMYNHRALDIVHNDLMYDTENLGTEKVSFNKIIELKNVYFEYEPKRPVLMRINITINKGEKIAFVGESGSGKSTLIDLIIGLYKPKKGTISVDFNEITEHNVKDWRTKVGYIPQSVYLFDGTVGENVAFGSEYDADKIDEVLKKSKIYDFLQTKDGANTFVGEGGIMLSGGQKQRIAIARALYIDPEILVLDEATSALDKETEAMIMDEIYDIGQDKTLIIIAHRLSTIERCEKIYKIENGEII